MHNRYLADQMLIGDNAFTEFKGAFTEQYVLQQLLALGLKPYYWSNTKTPSEIDFIIQDSQRVIPVEVKAEENVRGRSLAPFITVQPRVERVTYLHERICRPRMDGKHPYHRHWHIFFEK